MNTDKDKSDGGKTKMSGILIRITVLVLVVFIISGGITLYAYYRTQSKLVEESKHKLIETVADDMMSSYQYMLTNFDPIAEGITGENAIQLYKEMNDMMEQNKISSLQKIFNEILRNVTETDFLNIDLALITTPPAASGGGGTTAIMASDDDIVYEKIPEKILDAADEGKEELLIEEGIPELGLEGAHLVTIFPYKSEMSFGQDVLAIYFRPMQEEIKAIDDFYSDQSRDFYIIMGSVVGSSIIILVVITFFVLSYLIRTRITRPIEELSSAAEKAMQGDLDVEVPVKKGEEFENLKNAFNQMIRSVRDIMDRISEGH
ncbi:MAG: HAMP domain-containing protein [Actinobacteria bacterium]|nr:HAMP domain-containing protein [Actinomycetota bacterium]